MQNKIQNFETNELFLDQVFSSLNCHLSDIIERTFNIIECDLDDGELDIKTSLEENYFKLYDKVNNSCLFAKQLIANSFINDDNNYESLILKQKTNELMLDNVFSTLDCRLSDNIEQTFNVIEHSLNNEEMDITNILEKNFFKLLNNINNTCLFAKQFIANSFVYNDDDDETLDTIDKGVDDENNQTASNNNE